MGNGNNRAAKRLGQIGLEGETEGQGTGGEGIDLDVTIRYAVSIR